MTTFLRLLCSSWSSCRLIYGFYSMSQKIFSDVFWHFLTKRLGIFSPNLHAYCMFLSMPDYKLIFNYLPLWQSYVIYKARPSSSHQCSKLCSPSVETHTGIFWHFPKREFLAQILHAYCIFLSALGYKFLFSYLQLWRIYAILSATSERAFRVMVDILCIWRWSRLIWHNFSKVELYR